MGIAVNRFPRQRCAFTFRTNLGGCHRQCDQDMPHQPDSPGKETGTPAARTRGRPPAAPEIHAAIRRRLLDATRAVFTRTGYHGLSVELVLAEAELSRPTFYKHFRNTDEPIGLVMEEVNDRLIMSLLSAAAGAIDPYAAIEAALEAWRHWGEEMGPMLQPLFAELHDPHSPASVHRRRVLDTLGQELVLLAERFGHPRPTRLQVDVLLNGVEYLGYRFCLETPRDPASWKQTRDMMLRLVLGLLGGPEEWTHAMQLAQMLKMDLRPTD